MDDAKITEAIGKVKTDLPLAFKPGQSATVPPAGGKKVLATGPGADRGSPERLAAKMRVSRAQLKDHGFMRENQQAMSEARKAGTLELTE